MRTPNSPPRTGPPADLVEQVVAVHGKTGSGKTSLFNLLTKENRPTDPAVACTREPNVKPMTRDEYADLVWRRVLLVDLPGIGESIAADEAFWPIYERWLPRATMLLWLVQADTRAHKRDELSLRRVLPLLRPGVRLKVLLNKVDCLGMEEHLPPAERPTRRQLEHLPAKIEDVHDLFHEVIGGRLGFERSDVIPFSASSGWGLQEVWRLFFNDNEVNE